MGLLSFLGLSSKSDEIKKFISKGAIIIDVRTDKEFSQGNISGSKNIPLDIIPSKINEIESLKKPIIVCCMSGVRSAQAASLLKKHNIEVINGGGWNSLKNKI